ncbi:Phospholipase_D-nuclease N-terminal [Amphibacillus marinus]|uniref:Phospholipase_D-nuclease N-terminal n=1 Tax=Amphibacillus marinus TaxID=872970 RepID=A0A1H8RGX4_9BACI|nr:PLD nuclease N-terminal domain-containing protein [Amphibacillus marinus]SEO65655.1 Phospholipase_D-nuclease N-terminal [Amphibacillus marinus]
MSVEVLEMIKLFMPLIILQFILMVAAIIALFKTEKTNGPRWLWLLIILFVSMIGPVAFFIIGRRQE